MTEQNKTLVFILGSDNANSKYKLWEYTPWMFFHSAPSSYVSNKSPKIEGKIFDLVYFDFPAGKCMEWKNWSTARAKTKPSNGSEIPVDKKYFVEIRNNEGAPYPDPNGAPGFWKCLSVLSFYDWVKRSPPGSIASIQIFGHGAIDQPVLIGASHEWGKEKHKRDKLEVERDPNDTEFRLRDFHGSNPLAGKELVKFRTALDHDVFIKLWGCVEDEAIRDIVTEYCKLKSSNGRKTLKKLYRDQVKKSFPYKLATHLGVPVWATPAGYGSNPFEVDGPGAPFQGKYTWKGIFPPKLYPPAAGKEDWWWRVEWYFWQDTAPKFFKDLQADLDPLGYLKYSHDWVEPQGDA